MLARLATNDTDNTDNTNSPAPAKKPIQFSLWSLFVLMTLVALFFELTKWLGCEGLLLALLILAVTIGGYQKQQVVTLLLLLVLVACLVML